MAEMIRCMRRTVRFLATLGYHTFHCCACGRKFNKRSTAAFNNLEFPTDLVLLVVLWRLQNKPSLRDLAEMFLASSSGEKRHWVLCVLPRAIAACYNGWA